MSCSVGRRHDSDPVLLWLWCRPAATAPIRPLALGPPYAIGVALEKTKRQKKKKKEVLYPLNSNLNSMNTSKENNQRCRHADIQIHRQKIVIVKNLTAAYMSNKKINQ